MTEEHAAVVGSGVISFLPGVAAKDRESLMLATLFAQRFAMSEYQNNFIEDWFSFYKNQLRFLGGDATPASEAYQADLHRQELIENALKLVGITAGEPYADSTRRTLAALQNDEKALSLLEHHSQKCLSKSFQVIPCLQQVEGRVDMVIFHQALEYQENKLSFLFNSTSLAVSSKVALVRFNTRMFDQEFRAKLLSKLSTSLGKDIRALQV